jgi:HlyD family secretion protein
VDVAQAQVESAAAQLQALQVQLDKYTLSAPLDGVILTRGAAVGETATPGTVLFEIGDLQHLQITVYLPEEQFGLVKPGDQAQVSTDAYPERVFTARVDRLADQAEFTPRNVQTVEGRRNTVFAVYLSLDNADLALVPGMWADVSFTAP